LFPGDAGAELAWAVLCRGPFPRSRWSGKLLEDPISLFEQPIPAYKATFSRTGRNRYAARSVPGASDHRRSIDTARILELLSEMRSYEEICRRLGLTSTQLHQTLYRLRERRELRLRPTKEQSTVAAIAAYSRSRVKGRTAGEEAPARARPNHLRMA